MQPTIEILDRIRKNSRDNKEEIFTRLYRYLLRPDLYYLAYKNLYANKGAGTKGVNDDTADGFSRKKLTGSSNLWLTEPICRTLLAASTSRKSRTARKSVPWGFLPLRTSWCRKYWEWYWNRSTSQFFQTTLTLSSQQELPHCAEILEKRIFRCVVVYWGRLLRLFWQHRPPSFSKRHKRQD